MVLTSRTYLAAFAFLSCVLFAPVARAQDAALQVPEPAEFSVDAGQQGIPLPRIFSPSVDLSGRGFHGDITWPQTLAAPEAVESWQKEIGFRGMYRLQFNLWEISQLSKNEALQSRLIANYEAVIKKISDAGATVILDIYSVPQGQGKVLDRKSFPVDPAAFKQIIKEYIRYFSCEKKYNVWYEVWSAPDLDNFFLGRRNDYLILYRCVAEAVRELQAETKVIIPVGGPSTSWWFRGVEESSILAPERSLIYELIQFCYHNKLPLDFITWHAYSTDPLVDRESTGYNKAAIELIREWLSYFNFPRETPLIVDEWNFDNGFSNVLEERRSKSNVCASYVVSRLKNMYDAGLTGQVFFSLEDFQANKEGVVRNVGLFWYEQSLSGYKGGSKSAYNAFRMLSWLGNTYVPVAQKPLDEFIGCIATRGAQNELVLLFYNYSDPDIFRDYLARLVAPLGDSERNTVLKVLRDGSADKKLRLSKRVRNLIVKGRELNEAASRYRKEPRNVRLSLKNLAQSPYSFQRFTIDGDTPENVSFTPAEEKELTPTEGNCQEELSLAPYSVTLVLLKPRPAPAPVPEEQPAPAPIVLKETPSAPPAAEQAIQLKNATQETH
ncbi:MAG: GH39 family glycosyl hydrolase [Deltaproteobacteria bacterium]